MSCKERKTICKTCQQEKKTWTCASCGVDKPSEEFSKNQWHNRRLQRTTCIACEKKPMESFYECALCGPLPASAFPTDVVGDPVALKLARYKCILRCTNCAFPACTHPTCPTCKQCGDIACKRKKCRALRKPLHGKQRPQSLQERDSWLCSACKTRCWTCARGKIKTPRTSCGECLTAEFAKQTLASNK